jgi:hypothetical protein
MLKGACSKLEREKAPAVMALVQPNSSDSGLKKTPKVKLVPALISKMQKAAIAII